MKMIIAKTIDGSTHVNGGRIHGSADLGTDCRVNLAARCIASRAGRIAGPEICNHFGLSQEELAAAIALAAKLIGIKAEVAS